jgi:hypothetical protein
VETVNPDDYSDGGILRPGVTLAVNRTGKPERVTGPTGQEA